MQITIQCFGLFRQFGGQIALSVAEGAKVRDLRVLLGETLKQRDPDFNTALIEYSRFAHASALLKETAVLEEAMELVILPPVSGG